MTLTEAQTYLSALQTAYLSGEKQITVDGRTLIYQSTGEMQTAMDRLQRDIARAQCKPSVKIATWTGTK